MGGIGGLECRDGSFALIASENARSRVSESEENEVGNVDAADDDERRRDGVTRPGAGIPEVRDFDAIVVCDDEDVGDGDDDGGEGCSKLSKLNGSERARGVVACGSRGPRF